MSHIDLKAETEIGHHWSCSQCTFSTLLIEKAIAHCGEESRPYPAAEHTLHELPPDTTARNRARRVISCRHESGEVVEPRVTKSAWQFLDGRWEIVGVTAVAR